MRPPPFEQREFGLQPWERRAREAPVPDRPWSQVEEDRLPGEALFSASSLDETLIPRFVLREVGSRQGLILLDHLVS